MLDQDYPDFEVIAVDERSTDRTGEVLKKLKSNHPNLKVLHVEDLPEGWLGKNHALYLGATEAKGDWVLFTDSDVRFAPGTLQKAVGYATSNGLDHLTLPPEIFSRGVLLRSFVAAFELIFSLTQRPWRVGDPQTKEHVGVGAFNLIVEWHQSLGEAVRGLGKSMFPGVYYRLDTVVFATLLLSLTNVLPFFEVFFASGVSRLLFGSNVALIFDLRSPGKALENRVAAPVCCAPSVGREPLRLRHAEVHLHDARERRHRVAGDEVSSEVTQREHRVAWFLDVRF